MCGGGGGGGEGGVKWSLRGSQKSLTGKSRSFTEMQKFHQHQNKRTNKTNPDPVSVSGATLK